MLRQLVDFILHIDVHLSSLIAQFGIWTYGLLFVIVFCETGLVVTPFLPGDSLLFAVGAFAAQGSFKLYVVLVLLSIAAVGGDTLNYWIGKKVGPVVFKRDVWFLKRHHLEHTQRFYEKYGNKTIMLSRFVPIVRTFAPFVAGIAQMNYGRFLLYNIIGGTAWVFFFVLLGFFFGNIPTVKENFSLAILAIILISVLPVVVEYIRHRNHK